MNTTLIIIFAGLAIFIYYIYFNYKKMKDTPMQADNDKIIHLNDKNFQQEISKGIVLVDFWAAWCMPCKLLAPILNETATEIKGNARIGKLNVEESQNTATKYAVRSIPTMILFKDGKEISRFVGVKQKDFLLKQLNNN
ncbi:MAG: thioredoxin [Bacteroidales bacterium]